MSTVAMNLFDDRFLQLSLKSYPEQVLSIRSCIESLQDSSQITAFLQNSDFLVSIMKLICNGDVNVKKNTLDLLIGILSQCRANISIFFKKARSSLDMMGKVLLESLNDLECDGPSATIPELLTSVILMLAQLNPSAILAKLAPVLSAVYESQSKVNLPNLLRLNMARILIEIITRFDLDGHISVLLQSGAASASVTKDLIRACEEFSETPEESVIERVQCYSRCLIAIAAARWPLNELIESHEKLVVVLAHDTGGPAHPHLVALLGLFYNDTDSVPSESLQDDLKTFKQIEACCTDIWSNIGNEDVISANLQELAGLLGTKPGAVDIASCISDFVQLLIQCLGNIDEQVMMAALNATYALLLYCPDVIHTQFMNRGGFDALADCLHDYNVAIRVTTLEILSVTVAHREEMRITLQTSGILKYIIDLVAEYGRDDDIEERIVEAAAGVISLALTDSIDNQMYLIGQRGVQILISTIDLCVSLQASDSTIEALLLTLSNLVYRNRRSQDEFAKYSGFAMTFRLFDHMSTVSTLQSALTLIVNAVDTCEPNQDAFGEWAGIVERIGHLLNSDCDIASLGCLLLSHATWNHPSNQALFSVPEVIKRVLQWVHNPKTSVFALMGLSNLSYQNRNVQEMVSSVDGIAVVYSALVEADDVAFIAITTTLSNLVNGDDGNAETLARLGGVELLLSCITDDDDDEISKRAFSTIVQMGPAAIRHIVSALSQFRDHDALETLKPYLTALNGVVYLSSSIEPELAMSVIHALIPLLMEDSFQELMGYALFTMVNITVSHQKFIQTKARFSGVFDAIESCMKRLAFIKGDLDSFTVKDIRDVIYQLLDNLLTGNVACINDIAKRSWMIDQMLEDCQGDVKDIQEPVEVVLTLCEHNSAIKLIGAERMRPLIERLKSQGSSQIVQAKALQIVNRLNRI